MSGSIGDARIRRIGAVAGIFAATVALAWVAAATAQTPPAADAARARAERVAYADQLMRKEPPERASKLRQQCIAGQTPNAAQRMRAEGWDLTLDPSDECPTVLARVGKDGGLAAAYERLITELAGDIAMVPTLPAAIGVAVTKGAGDVVAIGNQRGAKITSALALDAGFTVAYQKGVKHAPGMPDLATLKQIAERCLAQNESNLALCYSTGYVYAARAVSGLPLVQ